MKKSIILFPLLLSGCFMYNNLQCAIRGNCPEVVERELEETARLDSVDKKAEQLIAERCTISMGTKKGTMAYMNCQELFGESYRINRKYIGIDEAYRKLRNSYFDQEETCNKYGFKPKTENYKSCLAKLQKKQIDLEAAQAAAEAQRYRNSLSCRTHTAFGTTYTTCD